MVGLLFGSIGLGYVAYGRRQAAPLALLCGVALVALPYVIPDALVLAVVSVVLMGLPFLLRR